MSLTHDPRTLSEIRSYCKRKKLKNRCYALPVALGTLIVNVVGCLLLGFLAALMIGPLKVSEPVRLMLTVGFLGGLTTFSSFGYETMALAGHGKFLLAGANILTNNVLSLVAVWVGVKMAQLV